MKLGKIYKITNLVNNKIYIGQTIRDLSIRFKQHCKREGCPYLHNAILRYGKDNFKIELIEEVPITDLDKREIYWISFFKSTEKEIGYNLYYGGKLGNSYRSKLTDAETERLIEMEKSGISHIKIGEHFNIDRKTVTYILRRHINYCSKRVKIEYRTDLEEMKSYILQNNPTMKQVCNKFKIGRNTLKSFADSFNYKFIPSYERRKSRI